MRVLIQMGDSYPFGSPCANRIRTFYEQFTKHGDTVKVLAPKTENRPQKVNDVTYCPNFSIRSKSSLNRLFNQMSLGISSLFLSFKAGKADVVITTSPPPLISVFGWMIAKFKRAKLVYDVRDIWPDVAWEMGSFDRNSFISKVFEFSRNFMLKHSDLVSVVSNGKKEKLQSYCPDVQIEIISNGLDEDFLETPENTSLIKKYNLNDKFTCVYVGNLGLAQGLTQLMNVAKKAHQEDLDAQFILFGSGVEENKLKEFVVQNNLDNVKFAGRIPSTDIYTVLKYSDMCFVSLVNKNLTDSVPTKLYEGLAVGCPVLLAAAGESAELVKRCKLGIAVEPYDMQNIWEAFKSFYENIDAFNEYKQYSTDVILEDYSRQKIAEKMRNVIYKLHSNT